MAYIVLTKRNFVLLFTLSVIVIFLFCFFIPVFIIFPQEKAKGVILTKKLPLINIPIIVHDITNMLMALGFVLSLLPFTTIIILNHRYVTDIEEKIPYALRSIAESIRSGLTFIRALERIAIGGFGNLSREMRFVVSRIHLGSSVEEALETFSKRIETPITKRFTIVLIEAYRSGGRVAEVLEIASKTFQAIIDFQRVKKEKLRPYVLFMYAVIIIFTVIASLIYHAFIVPLTFLEKQLGNITGVPTGVPIAISFLRFTIDLDIVRTLLFYAVISECIIGGLIVGKVSEGKASLGLFHIVILILISTLLYYLVLPSILPLLFKFM